jgi:hypothetical protein
MYICLITGIAASGAACFEGSRLDFHKALKCAPSARPRPSPIAFQPFEVGHGSAHRIELLALLRGCYSATLFRDGACGEVLRPGQRNGSAGAKAAIWVCSAKIIGLVVK